MGFKLNPLTGLLDLVGSSGGGPPGDVFGPGSSTDNAVVRFDGTTGKLIQNSLVTIDDAGNITATNLTGSSSGTNTGDVSLTAVGATPNANAASLAGQVLTLQPANASFPGVLLAADWSTFNSKQSSTLTQNHILVGNASNIATDVTMSGEASIVASGAVTLSNAAVIAKVLTGYSSGAGTISAADSILSAFQKINGNDLLKLPLAGGTMSGVIAMGGNKITGLASGTTSGDALQWGQIGAANGIAGLDGGGKVPYSQLPSALMTFKGAWDASTNSPTLADGTGTTGDVYRASVAGTQNLGSGPQTWAVGDFAIYNGTIWQHSPAADGVSSVNGATGAVTVNAINQLTGDVTTTAASQSQSKAATVAAIQGTTVSGTTGTVNVVFSASPTITGTLSAATISASGPVTGSNLSGTNSGDITLTAVGSSPNANGASLSGQALTLQPANTSFPGVLLAADWNTFNSKQSATLTNTHILVGNASNVATDVAASGDLTLANTGAFTLNTVNGNVGSFGSSTSIPSFTVNAKGLITAASGNAVIAPAGTLTGTTLNATVVSSSLTSVGTITTGVWNGTTIDIGHGGTNSSAALNNNRVMVSSGGAIVEAAAITGNRALASNASGIPVASATTDAELAFVSGVTSSIQTQINNKASLVTGDIEQTSFSAANNQSSAANVTGFLFSNASVRSFKAQVSVTIVATGNLYETFDLIGIQRGADWVMSQVSTGDISGIVFSITTSGQVQYTSTNVSGFTSDTMKFRAWVTSV